MIEGAIIFAPLICRWLGSDLDGIARSDGFVYAVHRRSQMTSDDVQLHLQRCTALFNDALALPGADYFGIRAAPPPPPLSPSEFGAQYDSSCIAAAFRTIELAIDPVALAERLKARVLNEPRISVRLGRRVTRLLAGRRGPAVVMDGPDGSEEVRYDHVVNALWGGRLAADATRGITPSRPWIHRFKYGIRIREPVAPREMLTTIVVHGPFADVVRYDDGSWYVSWYPACLLGVSTELAPPDWSADPDSVLATSVLENSLAASVNSSLVCEGSRRDTCKT